MRRSLFLLGGALLACVPVSSRPPDGAPPAGPSLVFTAAEADSMSTSGVAVIQSERFVTVTNTAVCGGAAADYPLQNVLIVNGETSSFGLAIVCAPEGAAVGTKLQMPAAPTRTTTENECVNGVRQTFLLFCCFANRSIRFA